MPETFIDFERPGLPIPETVVEFERPETELPKLKIFIKFESPELSKIKTFINLGWKRHCGNMNIHVQKMSDTVNILRLVCKSGRLVEAPRSFLETSFASILANERFPWTRRSLLGFLVCHVRLKFLKLRASSKRDAQVQERRRFAQESA